MRKQLLLHTALALLLAGAASATVIHANSEGTGDYPAFEHPYFRASPENTVVTVPFQYSTIAEAIEATGNGDTILVYPGVYYESNLDLGAGVALIGVAGRDSTTIDASGGGSAIRVGYARGGGRASDTTRIEGFTITGATDSAVKLLSASPTIASCTITGNTATMGAGMYCSASSPTISDCVFWDNTAAQAGAVYCTNYSDAHFTGCTFSDNSASYCSTMKCDGSSPTVEYSVFAYGNGEPVVSCETYGHPVITKCVVYGNHPNDELCGVPSANIFASPLMCDHAVGDLTVCAQSPCLPENNAFGRRIGAFGLGECSCTAGTMIAVPLDYPTITDALAAAGVNDTVLVAPGVYYERDLAIPYGVPMLSVGGPESTVVDAQGIGSVVRLVGSGERGARTIEGFTITGGADSGIRIADGTLVVRDCVIAGNSATDGGGINAEYAGVCLENCDVSDNTAGSGGGVWALGSFISVAGSSFSGNTVILDGGGIQALESYITVTGSRFEENSTSAYQGCDGGGVMGEFSEVLLESSDFVANTAASGGGIYCRGGNSLVIAGCSFVGNQSLYNGSYEGGGAVHCNTETMALISSSTFCGNIAFRGGGIHMRAQASVAITGCTFVENDATSGSGAFVRNSTLGIDSSILAHGLGGSAVLCADNAVVATHYCDVYGNAGGDSLCGEHSLNVFSDPAFCDTTGLRFYLQECSPCAGTGAGGADIGAWGVNCPCGDPSGIEESAVAGLVLLGCAPNPSRSGATVYYRAPECGGRVELRVFDVSGRSIATVCRSEWGGVGAVEWDGRDSAGNPVSSGVYFYELRAGEDTRRGSLVVLR